MIPMIERAKSKYMISCALAKQGLFDRAFEELSSLIAVCEEYPDAYKLRSYIGFVKLKPPRYEQSLLDMNQLITLFPNDLDLVTFH